MIIYLNKSTIFLSIVLGIFVLISVGCDTRLDDISALENVGDERDLTSLDDSDMHRSPNEIDFSIPNDGNYNYVIRFEKSGVFHINDQEISLGDPLVSWINVLGKESRVTRNRSHIWDELGISLTLDDDIGVEETVIQIRISFADYYEEWPEKKERYPDGPPHGTFTGLIKFGDAWIDRDRKVEDFLSYESTSSLHDSYDRSLVFRDTYVNDNGLKVSFSITQGLSKSFPEGPNNITAYIFR